jgi:hypothetical protein
MRDLETAAARLKKGGCSLVVVKNNTIICCREGGGIKPLLHTIDELGDDMKQSCVADKVIGKAAAALCISGGVAGIYTPVMSRAAVTMLEANGIVYSADRLVQGILNIHKTDLCPLEKLTAESDNYRDILAIVKNFTQKAFR